MAAAQMVRLLLPMIVLYLVAGIACGGREVPNPSPDPRDHVERTPPNIGHWTIEEAQRFTEFALYWVGEEFRGLPLTDIYRFDSRSNDPPVLHPESSVTFMYGTCKPPGGLFAEGGCSPPIQIIVQPYCATADLHLERSPFRENAEISSAEIDSTRFVWTGDVAVTIYAYGESGGPRDVAEALVSMNGRGPTEAGAPLPAITAQC